MNLDAQIRAARERLNRSTAQKVRYAKAEIHQEAVRHLAELNAEADRLFHPGFRRLAALPAGVWHLGPTHAERVHVALPPKHLD